MQNLNIPLILVIVLIVLSIAYNIYQKKKTNSNVDKLVQALAKNDMKTFDELSKDPNVIRSIPAYNYQVLMFNASLMRNDGVGADKAFDTVAKMKMTGEQAFSLCMRALFYYSTKADQERLAVCKEELLSCAKDQETKDYVNQLYRIVVDKSTEDLDALVEKVNQSTTNDKYLDEYLISLMYGNLNDTENAKKYFELSQQHAPKK